MRSHTCQVRGDQDDRVATVHRSVLLLRLDNEIGVPLVYARPQPWRELQTGEVDGGVAWWLATL